MQNWSKACQNESPHCLLFNKIYLEDKDRTRGHIHSRLLEFCCYQCCAPELKNILAIHVAFPHAVGFATDMLLGKRYACDLGAFRPPTPMRLAAEILHNAWHAHGFPASSPQSVVVKIVAIDCR